MKVWKINRAQDQVRLARQRLGDYSNPPSRIVCPAGMKSRTYESLVAKIERLEAYIARELIRGLK